MRRAGGWSWRTFWVSLVALSSLLGLWGLATPLFAVPDEPAHFLKAAGVARGQVTGLPGLPTAVEVPPALAATRFQTGCFVFRPEVPADCAPGYDGPGGRDVEARTQAGRYPPGSYALVGLPTLVWTDLEVLYAVRGVSAALCAALLAAAVTAAAATGSRLLVAGVGVAATPMVLFLASGVNPSGPELAAAVALWTAGSALVLADGPPSRPVLATAGLAAVVLALARPISPFWVAVLGLSLLLLAGGRRCLELVRHRSVRVWLGVLVLAGALQAGWVLAVGALELYGGEQSLGLGERVAGSLGRTDERLQQMVGWFGWLDTPAPLAVHSPGPPCSSSWWCSACAVRARAGPRCSPPSSSAPSWSRSPSRCPRPTPSASTGRAATLPLAVGVPLVAAVAARHRRPVPTPLLGGLLAVLALCHLAAFVVAPGRYTVGTGNGLGLLDVAWVPPLPALLLAVGAAVAALAWSALLLRAPVGPARD